MGSHAALIARLEKAKEGNRELSDQVLLALGLTGKDGLRRKDWDARGKAYLYTRRYDPTRNLQDAVDLVPEGRWWSVGSSQTGFVVCLDNRTDSEYGKTPALAFCVAILRAVEAEGVDHE